LKQQKELIRIAQQHLTIQQNRLSAYLVQARLAIARLYDIAAEQQSIVQPTDTSRQGEAERVNAPDAGNQALEFELDVGDESAEIREQLPDDASSSDEQKPSVNTGGQP